MNFICYYRKTRVNKPSEKNKHKVTLEDIYIDETRGKKASKNRESFLNFQKRSERNRYANHQSSRENAYNNTLKYKSKSQVGYQKDYKLINSEIFEDPTQPISQLALI